MAKYHKTKDGTAWLEITWLDLMAYSNNPCPICDECGKDLIGCDHIVLIPILNEAFCPKCGKAKLSSLHRYPEDRLIEERRERQWMQFLELQRDKKRPLRCNGNGHTHKKFSPLFYQK